MKTRLHALLTVAGLSLALAAAPAPLHAQNANGLLQGNGPGAGNAQFVIKNINLSTPKTPEFTTLSGEGQTKRYTLGTWLEMEVEFSCTARTPEVDFKYFVVLNGMAREMLTGDETLVDVPAGQSLFTVMYVAPRTLTTALKGQPVNATSVTNIAVEILRPGVNAPAAIKLLKEGGAFYNTFQQIPGFVLPKPHTPFANLYWDRYEQVKEAAPR